MNISRYVLQWQAPDRRCAVAARRLRSTAFGACDQRSLLRHRRPPGLAGREHFMATKGFP